MELKPKLGYGITKNVITNLEYDLDRFYSMMYNNNSWLWFS